MSGSPYVSLQRTEAHRPPRAARPHVVRRALDLARGRRDLRARSRRSASAAAAAPTFLDLKPVERPRDPAQRRAPRPRPARRAGGSRSRRSTGEQRAGGRRGDARSATTARACTAASTPPTGGTTSTACPSWTPRRAIFACFDQPDLKAPYTVARHRAPRTGSSSATPRASRSEPGPLGVRSDASRCRRTSSPLVAGPYHLIARRARRHPARAQRAASIAAAPRRATPTSCSR